MTYDEYGNLTITGVSEYLKEKEIFPVNADLTVIDLHAVKESIDGYVNLIFHVYDETGKSIILKQMLSFPRFKIEEERNNIYEETDFILDLGRMRSEIATLIFWNSVSPGICPEIYLFDETHRIIVMEDLMALSLLRYELCRMSTNPNIGEKIGTFFGKNLFFSSNLHLTKYKKKAIEHFFTNPEYKALCAVIFETDNVLVSKLREMVPGTEALRQEIIENQAIQNEIKRLRQLFIEKKECLIHTDLHSSNVMVNSKDLRIIDGEFAGFGPLGQDFGRLTASFCLNYISWFGDTTTTQNEKTTFQNYLFETLNLLYTTFQKEFSDLVHQYRTESYSLKQMDVDHYLLLQFQDALSFTGVNLASRLAYRGMCYDIERLPEANRRLPCLLGLEISKELLLNHRNYHSIDDFIRYLKNLA